MINLCWTEVIDSFSDDKGGTICPLSIYDQFTIWIKVLLFMLLSTYCKVWEVISIFKSKIESRIAVTYTNGNDIALTSTMYFRHSVPAVFISFQTWDWLLLIGGLKRPVSSRTWGHDLVNHSCIYKRLLTLIFKRLGLFCQIFTITHTSNELKLNIYLYLNPWSCHCTDKILLNTILQLM